MTFANQTKMFDMLHRALEWPLIEAGLRSGVFDVLATPHTAKQVASKFNWQLNQTTLYLDALASLSVISKQQTVYLIAPQYSELLISNQPKSMECTLLHLSAIKMTTAAQILSMLNSDEPPTQAVHFDDANFWQQSTANLRSFHRSFASDYYAALLQNQPFWPHVNSFLEIGAGSDELAQVLTYSNPKLDYHIFDLPQVVEQLSLQFNGNGQIIFHSGDYNHTQLPQGYDLLFASMSLYYANDLSKLMRQAKQAINDGGCFVSIHEGLTEQRTQPRHHVIGRFIPAMRGNDVSFQRGEIAQHMMKAGFTQVHSQSITTPFGPMELDIAFK
ncbi:methyltransferase [Vibrio intestinalis]|uniref:methyltransferase n=1 Tax=Vibrio intestinalis TaxID=2933291 RepID=UPI0021A55A22|nr:methyltransferase [Vibrio intestinalis]